MNPENKESIREYRCLNCKKISTETTVKKEPLNYIREEDGTFTTNFTRFSAFCPDCTHFIGIVAEEDQRYLQDMNKKGR